MTNKKLLIVNLIIYCLSFSLSKTSSPQTRLSCEYAVCTPEQNYVPNRFINITTTHGKRNPPKTQAAKFYKYDCNDAQQVILFHAKVERIINNFEKYCEVRIKDREALRERLLQLVECVSQYQDIIIYAYYNKKDWALEINYRPYGSKLYRSGWGHYSNYYNETLIDIAKSGFIPKILHTIRGLIPRLF